MWTFSSLRSRSMGSVAGTSEMVGEVGEGSTFWRLDSRGEGVVSRVSRVGEREVCLSSSWVMVDSGEMSSYINMNTPLAPSDKTSSTVVILPISLIYTCRGWVGGTQHPHH